MSFRLRSDARKWFSEIETREPKKSVWDLYYFCLMVGLAGGRKRDPVDNNLQTIELVDYFIEDFKPAQQLILGLLIDAEIKKSGIALTEKAAVRDVIRQLISAGNNANLTEYGFKTLNAYASGGYDFMAAARDTKPQSPEEFHRDFVSLVDEAAAAA